MYNLNFDSNDFKNLDNILTKLEKDKRGFVNCYIEHNKRNGPSVSVPEKSPRYKVQITKLGKSILDTSPKSVAKVFLGGETENSKGAVLEILMHSISCQIEQLIHIPLRYVLKGLPELSGQHQVYSHWLFDNFDNSYVYYGQTKRGWNNRFGEHMKLALDGEPKYFFPKKLQELIDGRINEVFSSSGIESKVPSLRRTIHSLHAAGLNQDQADQAEQYLVNKYSFRKPNGLNMIPGGKEGIKFLHNLNLLDSKTKSLSSERRETVIIEYLNKKSKKGIPNPLIATLWEDESYAEKVICGPEGRLSPEDVRKIRLMHAEGLNFVQIHEKTGIGNERRIKSVIEGKTYKRIN